MQKLIFTNSHGQSVEIGYTAPFVLSQVNGLGDVNAEIQTQRAPYQDGSSYIDSTLEEREINLTVSIVGENVAQKRKEIASVFNPKLGNGVLRYENETGMKEIEAIPLHIPVFPSGDNRSRLFQMAMIDLLCPNPYWTTEEEVDQLVVWEGGLEFPLQLPTFFSQQSESKEKILLNEGDVETPILVVFEGPATSPITIENKTTGEHISVKQDLTAGERLEINTAFGQKRVTKVLADGTRQNAFHYITLDSSFFQLIQGNNLIDYRTGADFERAGVTITWRNRYLAV